MSPLEQRLYGSIDCAEFGLLHPSACNKQDVPALRYPVQTMTDHFAHLPLGTIPLDCLAHLFPDDKPEPICIRAVRSSSEDQERV